MTPNARRHAAGALALLLGAAGCAPVATRPDAAPVAAVELEAVPYYAQDDYQCGPAALAMVLGYARAEVTPQSLAPQSYVPALHGSLQVELAGAARRNGRVAYVLPGTIAAISRELAAGHPVLVLENFGSRHSPLWHYAVVVGLDPLHSQVILRSGREPRALMPLARFTATWARAGSWGLIVLAPGELPADDDAPRYLLAVAALENAGRRQEAALAYEASLVRWPGLAPAWLGLGNLASARAGWSEAARDYRRALELAPHDVAARNNLALALSHAGCAALAREEIGRAATDAGAGPLAAEVAASGGEIEARATAAPDAACDLR